MTINKTKEIYATTYNNKEKPKRKKGKQTEG